MRIKKTIFVLTLMSVMVLSSFKLSVTDQSISIILHPDNPHDKLTPGMVRILWLRASKKRWDKINIGIKPADRNSKCAERDFFLSTIIEMKSDEV